MSDTPQPAAQSAEATTEVTSEVTVWSLEQTSPADLRPAAVPEGDLRIVRSEVVLPEFSRFLYSAVGGDIHWTDRLGMSYAQWQEALERPGAETWVAYENGTAGRVRRAGPAGRRRGRDHVLRADPGVPGAADRRAPPQLRSGARLGPGGALAGSASTTKRVWLHTCSKDGPHAMDNYLRRGFRLFDTKTEVEPDVATPGPWPGAYAS